MGTLIQVSVGDGIAMGVNKNGKVFVQYGSDPLFRPIDSPESGLKFVTVGDGKILGIDRYDEVFYRDGISSSRPFGTTWRRIGGHAVQLSVGDGKIIIVDRSGGILYRRGINSQNPYGDNWDTLSGNAKWISVGDGRIASIRGDNSIWFRSGVTASQPFGDERRGDRGWEMMAGKLKQIEVGNGIIIGVNDRNEMMFRNGVTSTSLGNSWSRIPGDYTYATSGDGNIMGITTDGKLTTRSIPKTTTDPTENPGKSNIGNIYLEYFIMKILIFYSSLRPSPQQTRKFAIR